MANFCPHCGARQTRPGASFCPTCGRALGTGPPTLIAPASVPPVPSAAAPAQLIIQEPGRPPRTASLTAALTTIGRETSNTIVVQNLAVSRHHCQIERRGAEYWITDPGSTNGTSVNGQRMAPNRPRRLNDRDIIRIGDQHGNSVGLTFCAAAPVRQPGGTIHLGKLNLASLSACNIGRDPSNQVHLDHPTV